MRAVMISSSNSNNSSDINNSTSNSNSGNSNSNSGTHNTGLQSLRCPICSASLYKCPPPPKITKTNQLSNKYSLKLTNYNKTN